MRHPELSVCVDDFRLEIKAALDRARSLGFAAVDIKATEGPISPSNMSRTGQRHLIRHLSDLGLRLGSLRGPTDASSYGDVTTGERRLEIMRQIMAMASSIRVPVVSTTLGRFGDDGAEVSRAYGALEALANEADRLGVTVAIETVGVGVAELAKMLQRLNCPSVALCCDSGAMLMQGEDPHVVGNTLAGHISLVRARDAVAGSQSATGHEVALGEGNLDTPRFLAGLTEACFQGDIVVSRTISSSPETDLLRTKQHFEKFLR